MRLGSIQQAVRSAGRGGRIGLVAIPGEPMGLSAAPALEEVAVLPAIYWSRAEFEEVARLLARHPEPPGLLVTHRFGLGDAATAFAVAGDRAAGAIAVHLLP